MARGTSSCRAPMFSTMPEPRPPNVYAALTMTGKPMSFRSRAGTDFGAGMSSRYRVMSRVPTGISIPSSSAIMRAIRWRSLGEQLLVKYLDGNVKTPTGEVTHPGYPEDWYRRVAAEEGERVQVKPLNAWGCV